jgi:hypothetical protein
LARAVEVDAQVGVGGGESLVGVEEHLGAVAGGAGVEGDVGTAEARRPGRDQRRRAGVALIFVAPDVGVLGYERLICAEEHARSVLGDPVEDRRVGRVVSAR